MYTVYCHTNKINGKKYFGITSQKPKYRWGENGKRYDHNNHFIAAIRKYGWDNFEHDIIAEGLSREEACKIEKSLISKYNTQNPDKGYNIGAGGENGSEGSKRTPEQNKRKSEQMRVRMKFPETIEKIRQNRIGMTFSDEHIQHLRDSHIGHSPVNKGVPMSEEQKKILKDKKRCKMRKVFCFENDKTYESVHEASNDLGLRAGNISQVCSGKRNHTGGYHFKFI